MKEITKEEAIKYFKKFTEYTKNRAREEYKCECRNIQYAKDLEKRTKVFETILNYIDNSIPKEELNKINNIASTVTLEDIERAMKEAEKEYISKDKIKEIIKKIERYSDTANELIEEKIIIADSDSLNFGRKQAHNKDIEELKELLR